MPPVVSEIVEEPEPGLPYGAKGVGEPSTVVVPAAVVAALRHATGRELRPGEKVYTVLRDQNGQFIRQDYAAEAWQGPPADAFSFWAGRIPAGRCSPAPACGSTGGPASR